MSTKIDKNALKHLIKENNLMEIFPFLLNIKDKANWTISPSQFIQEMNLTTEERYKKLIQLCSQDATLGSLGVTVTPKILVFQTFEPRKSYSLLLQIRNSRKVLLPLRVICPDSAHFTTKFAGTPMTRIAPGLSVELKVTFTPSEYCDYCHHLILKTEEDVFYLPILAIGPRALLDIPDEITVPPAPVKISTSKIVIVRNIGTIPANFKFISRGCFKVEPAKGVIGLQEILELSIIFESPNTGNYSDNLYLNLETGEKLVIKLHGSAENVSVRLDKNCIIQDDTFVGLRRLKILHLQNNSQSLIRYSWKRNKTMKQDLDIIESMRTKYEALKDIEVLKDMKQTYYKLCSHKCHELTLERILNDELRLLQREQLNFQHPNFKIEPESGQIFPKSQAEMSVFFEPTKCGPVTAEAYLEVSGRDERLTLQLKGSGLGPLIHLSIEVLDIDFIFLCSVHTYEVIAYNKGDIGGTLRFKQEPLVFGGKVEVVPSERYLAPSQHVAFIISFTSNRQGEFTEKLNFEIVDSGEVVTMVLKGKIVSPTLHFDKTHIDFGTVPVGFPVSKEITLSNLSMVPVTFSLRILSDGTQPSISCEKYAKFVVKPALPKNPREFRIHPSEGVVEPFSSRTVTLNLTTNSSRKWATNLVVDMWDSETESVSCPIRLNSQTATVRAEPKMISIPFCFINFPYTRLVTLENISRISAFFYIIPQDPNELGTINYTANIIQGVIEPRETVKVTLTILTNTLGRQILPINFLIFGNESPTEMCQVCCVGQGPVVTLNSNVLHWGEVQLLQESTKFLTITNESPISANFHVNMTKQDSPWIVSPSHSTLEPEEKINLSMSLLLRDRGKYQDTMKIQITNGKTLNCVTTALGTGNSLLLEPNIAGKYDWGTLFSHKKYSFKIVVKNEGTKSVGIVWCPIEDYRQFVNMKLVNPPELIFKMEPTKVDLLGGSSKALTLEIYSSQTGSFTQKFYCHANADTVSKEVYMMSEMSAEFVEPIVIFDKSDLKFHYNVGASGIDEKLSDIVNIMNVSVLPLSVSIATNQPFYMKDSFDQVLHKIEIDLAGNETIELTVGFKAKENPERLCCMYRDKLSITFKENSKKLSLPLIGEINYPNVILLPRSVHFGCIPVGTSAYREFILVNVSPVVVHYCIGWGENASVINHMELLQNTQSEDKIGHFENSLELGNCFEDSEDVFNLNYEVKTSEPNREEAERAQKCDDNDAVPPEKPVLKIPEIEITESDVRNTVFPLIRKYYSCDKNLMETYRNIKCSALENAPEKPDFTKLFDITPFFGRLEKYESQIVNVCFQPKSPTSAHVEALLDIKSGPTEKLSIDGKAAYLNFSLSSIYIDFGRQIFCETASEYLKIRNTSLLEFDFETNTVDPISFDVNGDILIEAGVLIITPRSGRMPAMSEKALRIRYHPGLPGKFEETFQLRIGYLQPISIQVTGLAVFPQVHFDLPRSEIASVPVEIGYAAVSSITSDWLLTQPQCRLSFNSSPSHDSDQTKREDFVINQSDFIQLDDSWVVINKNWITEDEDVEEKECVGDELELIRGINFRFFRWDGKWTAKRTEESMPSNIDTDLAIERILAFKLLSKENSFHSNPRSIPNFLVPAYEIDFGVVTIGRSLSKSFTVTNYGPLPAVLYISNEKNSKNWVMHVRMRSRNEIKVGGTTQVNIYCDPKRSKFGEQYEKIEYIFLFEVYQGAKIPIKASAIVTYPFVTASCRVLNFGEVKCGNSKTMFMKLTNFGWVTAFWFLSFRLTSKEMAVMHQSGILDGQPMFHLAANKGVLHPNESTLVQISFKPEFGGRFSAALIVRVEEGFDEHRVTLSGEAIEPRLKISETTINFEPTLPYPRTIYKHFTIQNPCPFPVEFYFSDCDEQIYEEERALRALTQYYQTNELLLPARNPGEKLPNEIFEFYQYLLENLNTKYIGKIREKRLLSLESPSSTIMPCENLPISDTNDKKRLKVKRESSGSRPRSSVVLRSGMSISKFSPDVTSIFKDKTPDEIEDMLTDYLKGIAATEPRPDPMKAVLEAAIPAKKGDPPKLVQGLVVILHAAPHVNLNKFSNLCAQTVHKRALNIDRIVLEEVSYVRCDAGIILRSIIEQHFAAHFESQCDEPESRHHVFQDSQEKEPMSQKILDDLERKIGELFLLRDGESSRFQLENSNEDKISSIGSGKRDKMSTPNVKWLLQNSDILDGCDDLVFQLLKFRLRQEAPTGIVIENLQSRWINNPVTALKSLIKAADNIKDILVICLVKTYDSYRQRVEELEFEEEQERQRLREEALRTLEEEPVEDFAALNLDGDEKRELYSKFLKNRHDEYTAFLKMVEERMRLRNMKTTGLLSPSIISNSKGQRVSSHKDRGDKAILNMAINYSKDREKSKEKEKPGINILKPVGKDENEEARFLNFERQLLEISNFLEFWDRRLGISVEGQSVSKGKKSVTPRRHSSVGETDSKSNSDVGIHLWLVDKNDFKSEAAENTISYLNEILATKRTSYDMDSWVSDIPESMTFSVITSPPHRHPFKSLDSFTLIAVDRNTTNVQEEDASYNGVEKLQKTDSQLSLKGRKGSSETGKLHTESRTLASSRNNRSKKSLNSNHFESIPFKSRLILQEGETASWCVQFAPTKIGRYDQYYPINLVTLPAHNNYVIKCSGVCDIPRLDMKPENIFSRVAATKPEDLIYSPTFFYSKYCFDFGSVIPNQVKDENHRVHQAIFSLTNTSSLPVDLTVMFADDALREEPIGSQNFGIQPNSAYLKPDQTLLLNVYASPSKYGGIQEVLMLFVKGNPKIETIRIKCYGVKVSINVEPKFIDFDRMLLYRKDKRAITFTNNNLIPLFIALSGYNSLPSQFSFSAVKSWIQPLMSFTIVIEYEASQIQVISDEVVNVLVYDRVEAVEPVQTLSFSVSAEAYDASVDIFFTSKDDDHVDFDEIRIRNECSKTVTLKNTGKYPLGFKVYVDHELLEKIGNEEFYVSPDEGKLPVGKPIPIEVHFQAHTEISWKRVPIFKITLTEPYNKDELIASIPIQVSAKSFYSRYAMQPLSEVNIGPVQIGSQKTVTLSIENKGQFSFTYSIEPSSGSAILDVESTERKKSANRTSDSSTKEKPKKSPGTSLKMDSFDISPSSGVVDVRETASINVNFSPVEVKHYEELVIVKISESPPSVAAGNELKIVAEGCLPLLNLNDFTSIFREHQVKTSENELPQFPDIGFHTIFTIETKQFCFKNVCLGKTVEARIHLKNEGHIDCHVTSLVNRQDGKRSRSLIESEGESFWVQPSQIIIPPYESGTFVIYFRPEMLQNYKGQLMMTLSMPEKYDFSTTVFGLYGETCSPTVEIVEPSFRSLEGQGLVNFPPTTPGRSSTSVISFKNTGKIECKVVVEMNFAEEGIFSMVPKPECEKMLTAWEPSKPINYTTVVTTQPEETVEFLVFFKPAEIRRYACEIKLFIIDNGYENLCYQLSGEAILEEVVLEKIQTTMPFVEECPEDMSSYSKTIPGHYSLNLGHCNLNRKKKVLARLSNKTEIDYFKFEWLDVPAFITVQPKNGHLYPRTYKDVYFVFLPQESLLLEETPVRCSLVKIHFPNSPACPSWDSRLIHVMEKEANSVPHKPSIKSSAGQETALAEVIHVYGQEPEHEVIPDSNSEVVLHLSAVADYACLHCETTFINFADTFVFQNRTFSLSLENQGNVMFDYKVELKSVTYEPLKVDEDFTSTVKAKSPTGSKVTPKSTEKKFFTKNLNKPQPLRDESLLNLNLNPEEECLPEVRPVEITKEAHNPFQLETASGTIMPKEKAFCRVIFSPLDVYEYTAIIKIRVENTHPDKIPPEIRVFARSIMPYCHFDIPESDYISSGRRDYSRPGPISSGPGVPLDPQVKTIEVKILGIRITKPIHFHAINPTDSEYSFSWLNVTQNQQGVVQSLHCTFPDGSIQAGRQKLMEFVFVSHAPGTFEYFWKFRIPERNIEVLFLFVLIVQEPVIYFIPNNLIMHPTSVGSTVTDVITLINQDDVSSDFMFLPDSLFSEDRINSLKIQPLSGKINPKSEIDFRIFFTGKTSGKIVFNVKFKLKKLQSPIRITVEAMTYSLEPLVTFEDLTESKHVASPMTNNVIDFGKEIQIGNPRTVTFFLTNASKLSFYYEWSYDGKELVKRQCSMDFSQVEGHVAGQSRGECDLTVLFTKKTCLSNFPLKLKILRGPVYHFLINASATSPTYEFSFNHYDFGYCYIQNTDFTFYETSLVFKNGDTMEILLEIKSDNLSHFTYELDESMIQPGREVFMPIKFYPKECIKYEEVITFRIAGIYEKTVTLSGHGTEPKVSLSNISDSNIRLTAIRVGRKHSREFSIVNNGLATATVAVGFSDQLPLNLLCLARPDENPVNVSDIPRMITLSPSKPFSLRPTESCKLKIECNPQKRVSTFTETIYMQFQEAVNPLCVVTGSAVGPEFSLDKKYLTFGAVVANYSSALKLKLINSGDIGARFKWKTETLDEFSIVPQCGYLSAESDVIIIVNFHPKAIRRCVKKTVECKLFISDTETYPPLLLKLSGDCVDLPPPMKSVQFKCEVRQEDVKTIQINNRTGTDWRLMPVFSGEYFDGLELICVPSMTTAEYEITYNPLTMAAPEDPHKGSLFFCLPDGTGQLYDLTGVSLPPSASDVIEREVPCKTKYTELLKVKNWLRSHQKFRVTRTSLGSENDLMFTCSGADFFDMIPSSEKEYKVLFHAYKTGKVRFAITFTNEETKEYVWFDLTFNVVMCGPLEVITMKSAIRQLCQHEIKILNPLQIPVQYKVECTNPEITIQPISILAPETDGVIKIGYRPIHVGEKKEQLKVMCPELGVFPMEIRLVALQPVPEEPVRFETFLGSTDVQTIRVPNHHNSQAILHCRTTSAEFKVDERFSVDGQDSAGVDIIYEPASLGKASATLYIESDNAGNFTYSLIGNALKPLAKGPYLLKSGATMTIAFKNVLKESKIFNVYVDNPSFSVKCNAEEILPGNELKVNVTFQKLKNDDSSGEITRNAGVKYPVMGQLVVECPNPHIKWQYYLKGIVDKVSKS